MNTTHDKYKRIQIEHEQKWRDEIDRIPYIKFPADWEVQIIPPFSDAVVRFRVKLPTDKEKSIYLDARNSIGYFGEINGNPIPYWEVYPYQGDVGRCEMSEVAELLKMIASNEEESI